MKRRKKIIIYSIITMICVFITACILIPYLVMGNLLNRHIDFERTFTADEFGLTADTVYVTTQDHLKISAFEVKVDNPQGVVLCLSGIHGPSTTAYYGHSQLFKKHGYASILIDMRAHGLSEGERICAGYHERHDVDAVVDYVKKQEEYNGLPIVVMGLSMGASTAINAIGNNLEIDALISLSAFASWEDAFRDNMSMLIPSAVVTMLSPFVDLASYLKFGNEVSIKPIHSIKHIGERPALLIHSKEDTQVPFTHFGKLVENAPEGIQSYAVEGDKHFIIDHFLAPERDSIYSQIIGQFIDGITCHE